MSSKRTAIHLFSTVSTTVSLLTLLLYTLSGCGEVVKHQSVQDSLPQLLGVIEFANEFGTSEIAIQPGAYAYVKNDSGSIAILQGTELITVVQILEEGKQLRGDVVAHPHTALIYVADPHEDYVYVISDTTVVTTITNVGRSPRHLAINPESGYLYIASGLANDPNNEYSQISVVSGTDVIESLQVGKVSIPGRPADIFVPDSTSHRVYLAQNRTAKFPSIAVLATVEDTELTGMLNLNYEEERGGIMDIAVHDETGEVYMVENQGTVVYWGNGGEEVKRINLGEAGYYPLNNIAVDSSRNIAYVGVWDGPPSHVIALRENEVLDYIPVEYDPRQIVVDKTRDYVYVPNRLSGTMSVIRGTEVITTLSTEGRGPTHIGVDEERGYIYVSNADSHSVAVFGFE